MIPRPLAAALLLAFAVFQVAATYDTYLGETGQPRPWVQWTWPASWRMFTKLTTKNDRLSFWGHTDAGWVRLPMEAWFPTRWESGYRWDRSEDKAWILRVYAAEACKRVEIDAVEARFERWKARLGSDLQTPAATDSAVKLAWRCGSPLPAPGGVRR